MNCCNSIDQDSAVEMEAENSWDNWSDEEWFWSSEHIHLLGRSVPQDLENLEWLRTNMHLITYRHSISRFLEKRSFSWENREASHFQSTGSKEQVQAFTIVVISQANFLKLACNGQFSFYFYYLLKCE